MKSKQEIIEMKKYYENIPNKEYAKKFIELLEWVLSD